MENGMATEAAAAAAAPPVPGRATVAACNAFDFQAVDEWFNVYDLTFVESIGDAWNGDARLLAVIIGEMRDYDIP